MVNELRQLMREATEQAPDDLSSLDAVVAGGRRRVRRRRLGFAGTTVGGVAVVAAAFALTVPHGTGGADTAGDVPMPDAPTLRLSAAVAASPGADYTVLAHYRNDNLDRSNGAYFDGVTTDGKILFQDGPHGIENLTRYALLDPSTGDKDWLPDPGPGVNQILPVELGAARLVLASPAGQVFVFDRAARVWSQPHWPGLPSTDGMGPPPQLGPDGRLYLAVPATIGGPPPGGWPTSADGEADDSNAPGDTYDLWSASLSDTSDVRDEGVQLGAFAFTEHAMIWTDRTNGDPGRIHVRDLTSGEEHAFEPHTGDRCNLLSFGAWKDQIVMGEYCGTYGGVRDDRVQVVDTDGDQVVTVQGNSLDGGLSGPSGVVAITSYRPGSAGTYAYDLRSGSFLRLSDEFSRFAMGGLTSAEGQLLWSTPVNRGHGTLQHLGVLHPS